MSSPNVKPPAILSIDPDPATQKLLPQAFNRSGAFLMRYISDPRKTAGALRQLRPELVLVHAELQSPTMAEVFRAIAQHPMFAVTPIVLLAKVTADQGWASRFRSGVVQLLNEPFQAERHVAEVQELMRALPTRTGWVHGRGRSGELGGLIAHIRRTQRSGALNVDPVHPEQGTALFVRGGLLSATYHGRTGDAALWAMVESSPETWSFSELSGQAGDGAGIVIEVSGEDEPLVGVDLDVEKAVTPAPPAPAPEQDELGALLAPTPTPEPESSSPIAVLLVDDDPELCRMFSIILQRRGMKVTTAADGVEGFERARSAPFDVLVADLSMPRLDGWGLLRQVREDYRTREMPVAFLSCHDDYRESLRALDAGAQAYLSKSVKHDVLATQIRGLLHTRNHVRADIRVQKRLLLSIDAVGAQWLVQELGRQAATGRLDARDDWAQYQVAFRDGQVVGAIANAGPHRAQGEPAFIALLASRSANGSVVFGDPGVPPGAAPLGSMESLIDRAVQTLNEKERRAREALMVKARRIVVDQPLYDLYAQVGPQQWLRTAKLICEDGLPPAEVIARSDASPVDVEETLKDLLRRGVVSLEA
ncbi:MAG TPA: response regulator [Myxococcaceae bacterium]|nr:response regulator [Myxococcaceae bacterium]